MKMTRLRLSRDRSLIEAKSLDSLVQSSPNHIIPHSVSVLAHLWLVLQLVLCLQNVFHYYVYLWHAMPLGREIIYTIQLWKNTH